MNTWTTVTEQIDSCYCPIVFLIYLVSHCVTLDCFMVTYHFWFVNINIYILNPTRSTFLHWYCNGFWIQSTFCCILSDRGLSSSYVFLPGDVDPRHWQGEGPRASANHNWEVVGGGDKTEGNNKPDPALWQGQPQRHTVRTNIYCWATRKVLWKIMEEMRGSFVIWENTFLLQFWLLSHENYIDT